MQPARAHVWLGTFAALLFVFLWASAFVPSRVVSTSAPPFWILTIRFGAAGMLLLAGALLANIPLPKTRAHWQAMLLLGLTGNFLYLGLTYIALRHLSSGMGAIIASTNPLVLALLAPKLLGEPLTKRKCLGMVLGFSGVLVAMLSRAGTQTARPADVLLSLVAVLASVASTVIYKRMQNRPHPIMVNAIQLTFAMVLCAPTALILHGPPAFHFTPAVLGALIYLVLAMSIGASLLWFWLLQHGDASRVSAWYFLTPVFGLLSGAAILGEQLKWLDGLGLIIIALGLVLVTREPGPAVAATGLPAKS